jgi:hypothetical protein
MANIGKKGAFDGLNKLIAGIRKDLANQTFVIGKQTLSSQDVINILQGTVDSIGKALEAKTVLIAAEKSAADEQTRTKPFVRAFRAMVRGMFNDTPDLLSDFGLTPRRSPKKTLDVKVEAVAKNKATRKARGTKGKKELAKIKGTVPAVQPTPKS